MRKRAAAIAAIVSLLLGPAVGAQGRIKVLTNHIGYETDGPKHAVILGHADDAVTSFKIKESATDREVYAGVATKVGPVQKWKDWHFWTLDFNEVATAGTYYIECQTGRGPVRSWPFVIQADLLERNTLSNVIYYFKGQRSSGLLDKADRRLRLDGAEEQTADLHGGWFDATGDYGKHLSHLSFSTYFNPQQLPFTVWSLLKTYEQLDKRNDKNFRQYKRRLLDEAMHGADYLVRARDAAGSFYRSVAAPGPEKSPADRRVAADSQGFQIKQKASDAGAYGRAAQANDHRLYDVSYRAGGGVAIAALALASTHKETGDFTNADYLRAAQVAFDFLEKNNWRLTNDGQENILDDYCALLAATELYKATKQPAHKAAADRRAGNLMNRLTSSGRYKNYWRADASDRPFFHAADAGLPVVSLLEYLEIADPQTQARVIEAVRKAMVFELEVTAEVANPFGYSRQLVQNKAGARRTSFFFPHDTEVAPWWQGENARLASLAAAAWLAARYFKSDKAFYERLQSFAANQLNWILGLNPFDACMLHGSGRNNPPYRFFDSYEYTNAPGGICNGITAGFFDPEDIDFNLTVAETGADHDWRWGEQWLPHASWFLLALSVRQ
ncbi:MAG TPA: glycoside hydrolase family 9 protein [Blastocatellia bacterium]|nr:glycoside hydrolase family 9 protein [Blastocatellia bacterium]